MEWTKQILTKFIKMYREKPCLWQIKNESYTNKKLKKKAYEDLVKFLRNNDFPDADCKYVKAKIQNIRSAFRKETKKKEASIRSGAGPDDIYTPSLWYYDLLVFTKDQDFSSTSVSSQSHESNHESTLISVQDRLNYEDKVEESEDSQLEESREPQVFKRPLCTQYCKRRKMAKFDHNVNNFMKRCTEVFDTQDRPDEFEAIGINFAAKLRKMTASQQIFAEALMHKIVTRGLLQKLHENTDVVDVPHCDNHTPCCATNYRKNYNSVHHHSSASTSPIMVSPTSPTSSGSASFAPVVQLYTEEGHSAGAGEIIVSRVQTLT